MGSTKKQFFWVLPYVRSNQNILTFYSYPSCIVHIYEILMEAGLATSYLLFAVCTSTSFDRFCARVSICTSQSGEPIGGGGGGSRRRKSRSRGERRDFRGGGERWGAKSSVVEWHTSHLKEKNDYTDLQWNSKARLIKHCPDGLKWEHSTRGGHSTSHL